MEKVGDLVYYKHRNDAQEKEWKCIVTKVIYNRKNDTYEYDIARAIPTKFINEDNLTSFSAYKTKFVPNMEMIVKNVNREFNELRRVPKTIEEIRLGKDVDDWRDLLQRVRTHQERKELKKQKISIPTAASVIESEEFSCMQHNLYYQFYKVNDLMILKSTLKVYDSNYLIKELFDKAYQSVLHPKNKVKDTEKENGFHPTEQTMKSNKEGLDYTKITSCLQIDRNDIIRVEYLCSQLNSTLDQTNTDITHAIRILQMAMTRQKHHYVLCECKKWICEKNHHFHKQNHCSKRIVECQFRCDMKKTAEEWIMESAIPSHVTICPKRKISCTYKCNQLVAYDELEYHLKHLCPRRPPDQNINIYKCKWNCGMTFQPISFTETLKKEEEKIIHETFDCQNREIKMHETTT